MLLQAETVGQAMLPNQVLLQAETAVTQVEPVPLAGLPAIIHLETEAITKKQTNLTTLYIPKKALGPFFYVLLKSS